MRKKTFTRHDDPDFIRHKKMIDRIYSENGSCPDRIAHLEDLISLETSTYMPRVVRMSIKEFVHSWFKTKNPHYIDWVIALCDEHGVEPSPSLHAVIADASWLRLSGQAQGTASKIYKESAKSRAMILMCNLIYIGDPLHHAASRAARYINKLYGLEKGYKASTLDKEYVSRFRTKQTRPIRYHGLTIEEIYFNNWNRNKEDKRESIEQWEAIRDSLPLGDDDLNGERR